VVQPAFAGVEDVEERAAMPYSEEWKALDEKLTAVQQKLDVFTKENAAMLERIQQLELLLENVSEQPVTFWMPDDSGGMGTAKNK
jgi:hypothetical protein